MFGFKSSGANVYAQMGLETGVVAASPNKLIVMLYEGVLSACKSAVTHMQHKDIQRKGEMISKAVLIIESGLRASLDKKNGGEIALSLDALYMYMVQRLTLANLRNQPQLIEEVMVLLTDLKSAWEAIETQQMSTANMTNIVAMQTQAINPNVNRLVVGAN